MPEDPQGEEFRGQEEEELGLVGKSWMEPDWRATHTGGVRVFRCAEAEQADEKQRPRTELGKPV